MISGRVEEFIKKNYEKLSALESNPARRAGGAAHGSAHPIVAQPRCFVSGGAATPAAIVLVAQRLNAEYPALPVWWVAAWRAARHVTRLAGSPSEDVHVDTSTRYVDKPRYLRHFEWMHRTVRTRGTGCRVEERSGGCCRGASAG